MTLMHTKIAILVLEISLIARIRGHDKISKSLFPYGIHMNQG
jgi:hypothetical protein